MNTPRIKPHFLVLILVFLVLVGSLLRLYALDSQSYWLDETITVTAVLAAEEKGETMLDSGKYYFCPLYCYPTAVIAKTFGNTAFNFRLLSALAGIIFIILMFFISRRFFDLHTALLATFFTSFSYWQIAWSRQARWYTIFECLFWLSIFSFYFYLYQQKHKYLSLGVTAFFTILAILAHPLGFLLPLIFLCWFGYEEMVVKKDFKYASLLPLVIVLLVIVVLKIGLLYYVFQLIDPSYILPYYLNFYLRSYWLFIPFIFFALYSDKNEYKKETWIFISIFLAYLLPISFLSNTLHYRYLFHVTPVIYALGSLGMILGFQYFGKTIYKAVYILAIALLFFTYGGGVLIPRSEYFLETDDVATLGERPHYSITPQPNWNKAYGYIRDHRVESNIVISSLPQLNKIFFNEPGYWLEYKYLGPNDTASYSENGKENYVGASVISDLPQLKTILAERHGFIVFDQFSASNRIPQDIIQYIQTNLTQVLFDRTNSSSAVIVYSF